MPDAIRLAGINVMPVQTKGRETRIWRNIDDDWRLVTIQECQEQKRERGFKP